MRLKRLRLVGFKSFAGRTDLELDRPLTALVGPNGCGKSNIVDAVRWVLGEQSAKQLRGREMADVIFGGTDRRKPTGYAEVSLTLSNEDRTLDVEYDEVVLTRRLYRSGESEYLLNTHPCRLRDIRDLLLGTGLGMNAYSIIEQGKVDALLTASARERRTVFEEAAGIRQFKVRRHECELKLDRTEQNLLRVGDIIEEVEKRLRSVKYQAAKARRYKAHTARLKELRARLSLGDYRRLVEAQADLRRRLAHLVEQIDETEAHRRRLADRAAEADTGLARLDADLNAAERLGIELTGRLTNARAATEHHRDSADRLDAQAERHDSQVAETAEKLAAAQRRRDALRAGLAELTADTQRREAELNAAQTHHDAAARALDDQARRLEDAKTDAIDLLRRLGAVQNELGSVAGLASTLSAQRQRQTNRRDELADRATAARADAQRLTASHADLTAHVADAERRLGRLDAERRRGLDRLNAAQAELAEARQRLSALASRRDLLARLEARLEGVAEAVKTLLDRSKDEPGVHGLVADLVRVPRPYVAAIEAALSEAADFLVVDSRRRALTLLRALEPADAAGRSAPSSRPRGDVQPDRVGFVCCDRAEAACEEASTGLPAEITSLPGYVGRAGDLVKAAPVVRAAIRSLLGDTLVVRDLETAEALVDEIQEKVSGTFFPDTSVSPGARGASGKRYLTDGRLLAMVRPRERAAVRRCAAGGQAASGTTAASQPAGGRIWRRSELEHLAERIADLEAEIARRERARAETDNRLQALQARHADCAAECDRYAKDLVRTAGELDRARTQTATLDDEVALLESEIKATEEDLAEAESTRADLTRRRAALEADQERLRARIADEETALEARQREVAERREALTEMKVALAEASARRTDTEANLAATEQDLVAWQRSRDTAAQAAESARAEAERARHAAHEATERIDGLRRQQQEVAERRTDLAEQRRQLRDERDAAGAERDRAAAERDELNQQRQALEVKAGEARVKCEDLVQRTREDLGMDLAALYEEEQARARERDLSPSVEDSAPASAPPKIANPKSDRESGFGSRESGIQNPKSKIQNLDVLRAEIAELRQKIDRLGGVNLEAIDELDELEIRATFLTKQRDDLLKAKADLEQVIRKINRKCREMFTTTFEQVREHFQDLFRKLFGGGRADMFLEAAEGEAVDVLESGIEIIARPPGKEPRVLSLLSGGEKVMTAVALLLAVFRSNPSPFCLLDEVDAALDESAIGRFIEVLKAFLDRSQFIIVTHSKRTMAAADVLYGITMPEPGVSRVMTMRLQEVEQRLAAPRVA